MLGNKKIGYITLIYMYVCTVINRVAIYIDARELSIAFFTFASALPLSITLQCVTYYEVHVIMWIFGDSVTRFFDFMFFLNYLPPRPQLSN